MHELLVYFHFFYTIKQFAAIIICHCKQMQKFLAAIK